MQCWSSNSSLRDIKICITEQKLESSPTDKGLYYETCKRCGRVLSRYKLYLGYQEHIKHLRTLFESGETLSSLVKIAIHLLIAGPLFICNGTWLFKNPRLANDTQFWAECISMLGSHTKLPKIKPGTNSVSMSKVPTKQKTHSQKRSNKKKTKLQAQTELIHQ